MMEETDKVDSVFLKGFNEGYVIAQNMPELAEILANIKSNSERMNGLRAGRNQYNKEQIEQLKSHLPGWLKNDRSAKDKNPPTPSKDQSRHPDRD